jgi:hypothetical protein
MKRFTALASVAVLFSAAFLVRAEEAKKEAELKCPVSGAKASKDHAVDHNGGKVYLCCDKCPKAFAADTAKFAAKANEQLVLSGQATQIKCPLTGGKLNPEAKLTVAGVEVKFCCNNCKGKAAAAKGDEQLALVLSDAAFKKGFEIKKEEKK